jgi:hypothetical protein
VSGTSTTAGFPTFMADPNGIRLEPCLTTADQSCVLLSDAGFNSANPVVYPTNFPSEFFYFLADSELVAIPSDASCGGAGGTALLRIATEGSYPGGIVLASNAIWFNRVRVTASGLCPARPYKFETPYGEVLLASDSTGAIRANTGTVDITSTAVRPITPGFLVADPNAAPTPPAGYIGDGRSFQKVVGSQYVPVGASEPANYFEVINPSGTSLVKSDKFLLSGRLAAPLESSLSSRDFGSVAVGQQSVTTTTVTITNRSNVTVTGLATSFTGTNGADFIVAGANTCAAASLAPGVACSVGVRFAPTSSLGVKTAALEIGYDGLRSPISVALTGTAISAGALSITSPVNFGSVAVGSTSTQLVTIRNTALLGSLSADVTVSGLVFTGPFGRVTTGLPIGSCSTGVITLTPQAQCTITVRFTAAAPGGAKTGSLVVNSNVAPVTSTFSGTSLQAAVTASPTSVSFATKGSTSQTINVTNTGTAPMSFLAPVFTFSSNPGTVLSATNKNCTNVAPGAKCSFSITFTPIASTTTINSVLTVNTNAGNALKITITAVRK